MAIGIVSDIEYESELDSLVARDPVRDPVEILTPSPLGRGENNLEVPETIRKIIGECALEDGSKETISTLAKSLDISPSQVSAYKHGATSTASYNESNQELKAHTDTIRDRISRRALSRVSLAISSLTKDKIDSAKARDIAGIAKDMSAVVKNLEQESEETNRKNVNYIIFAPRQRSEESFDVIHVSE